MKNAHIDGKLRGLEPARDTISPTDRPPLRLTLAPAKVSATGTMVEFRPWHRWMHVEDDGGGILFAETQDGCPEPAPTGAMIYLPNVRVRVSYSGTAPARVVKLRGYNADDARIVSASSSSSSSSGGSGSGTQDLSGVLATPLVTAGPTRVATIVPNSALGRRVLIESAPVEVAAGIPIYSNYADSFICVADTEAKAEAGEGTLLAAGGDTEFVGVCYVCEIGHVKAGGDGDDSFVLYQVLT